MKNLFFYTPTKIALFLVFFAFLARVTFIEFYHVQPLAGGDPKAFWSFAEGIFDGVGFRSPIEPWVADRPPLYSYFLAGIFLLFGKDQLLVFMTQGLLASIASGVFFLGATRILDKLGSLVGGLFFAVFPAILFFTKQILTEAIYIPIWVFLFVSLLYLKEKPNVKILAFGTGIFLGLLALVRREALLPGGILVITLLWDSPSYQWKNKLQQYAIIFITTGLVILPWLVRNYQVLGKPVLSSSGGYNFMVGNNPYADGAYSPPPPDWQVQFQGKTELERDALAWKLSLEWIREHPDDFLRLLPKKYLVLWGLSHNLVLDFGDATLILLCIPGLVRLLQRRTHWKEIAIISLVPVLTTTLVGVVFVGAWRYRQLVYPGLIMLAGYGITQLASWYLSLQGKSHMSANVTQIF